MLALWHRPSCGVSVMLKMVRHSSLQSSAKSKGLGLVELMVTITIGLVVIAGVVNVFASSAKSNSDVLKATRLNQELRAAMDIMTRDITRAGYWSVSTGANSVVNSSGAVNLTNNPFTAGNNDLAVTGSCLTYTYAVDDDNTVDPEEKFGFQLINNTLYMRSGGANLGCTQSANNTWEPITNPELVKVTGLSFEITRRCTNVTPTPTRNCTYNETGYVAPTADDTTVTVRRVDITLKGELAADAKVQRELFESVRVRNDLIDRYGDGDDDDDDVDDLDNTHSNNEDNDGEDDEDDEDNDDDD